METLCELEMKYIEKYDTCNKEKGYNKSLGGLGVRQTERSKEHCKNLVRLKWGINPLANYTPEQWAIRNAKLSKAMTGGTIPTGKVAEVIGGRFINYPEKRDTK